MLKPETKGEIGSIDKNRGDDFQDFIVLDAKINIPQALIQVIDVLCRISDREKNDLLSYLIMCQLEWMSYDFEHILNLMKDRDEFLKNIDTLLKK